MNKLIKALLATAAIYASSIGIASAYDVAKLQLNVAGAKSSKYYVCISSVGCVHINSGNTVIPIDPTEVRYIFVADKNTYEMYPQKLPNSCNVTVNADQKLVVKASIVQSGTEKVHLANLHCEIA